MPPVPTLDSTEQVTLTDCASDYFHQLLRLRRLVPIPIGAMPKSSKATSRSKTFKHRPLDHQTKAIRLVRILPGHPWESCSLELKHDTIAAEYVCLSYVWGAQSTETHTVHVNNGRILVRENLSNFLRLARKHGIRDWLWIDAICIDQGNNIERNHQVQQMAEIYRNAKHVLVFPKVLGRLMHWSTRNLYAWHQTPSITRNQVRIRRGSAVRWRTLKNYLKRPQTFRALTLELLVAYLYCALVQAILSHILQSPYFERMLIMQELSLAQEKYIVSQGGLIA
jgi:hypothetical protein